MARTAGSVKIIEKLVKLPNHSSGLKSKIVGCHIKAKFASFWLPQIIAEKPGPDALDHNKLRTYKQFKGRDPKKTRQIIKFLWIREAIF